MFQRLRAVWRLLFGLPRVGDAFRQPCPTCGAIVDAGTARRWPGPPGRVLLECRKCGSMWPWPATMIDTLHAMARPWEDRETKAGYVRTDQFGER